MLFLGPDDGVTCFYCGNTLVDWSSAIRSTNENIVQLEHARFFPCRFINYTVGGKFVANAGYFHTVSASGEFCFYDEELNLIFYSSICRTT